MNIKDLIYVLLCMSHIICKPSIESDDITTILSHTINTISHKDVLIVCDIDNTLVHVADGFGGDEWFAAMIQQRIEAGDTIHMALQYILPRYFSIQNKIWLDLVQPETPRIFAFLQDARVAVMALTSRSVHIKDRTHAQLAHVGIDFTHTAPYKNTHTFEMHDEAYYEHGILYSATHNKGEVLLHFFDTIEYYPKKVIFIDDKLKYVEQVETALEHAGIDCIAIRYSHLDQKVKEFKLVHYEEQPTG